MPRTSPGPVSGSTAWVADGLCGVFGVGSTSGCRVVSLFLPVFLVFSPHNLLVYRCLRTPPSHLKKDIKIYPYSVPYMSIFCNQNKLLTSLCFSICGACRAKF